MSSRIETLRDKTGQLRTQEADAFIVKALQDIEMSQERHPLLLILANENLIYAQIIQKIAQSGDNTSVLQARINESLQQVTEDNLLAEQIAKEDNIDRKYGAVLRRLRENVPNESAIKYAIEQRTQTKLDVSMERILAQDKLKSFNIGRLNIPLTYALWFEDNPEAPELNPEDEASVRALYSEQRNLVNEVIANAGAKSAQLAEVNASQQELLLRTHELTSVLDQRLLWLPSTAPVSLAWPSMVAHGAAEVFSPQ